MIGYNLNTSHYQHDYAPHSGAKLAVCICFYKFINNSFGTMLTNMTSWSFFRGHDSILTRNCRFLNKQHSGQMKLTFLVPPCFDHKQPAERSAGCTRVVYLAPNIYELYVAALLEQNPDNEVAYKDFVYHHTTPEQFGGFLAADNSDVYLIWSVNLSLTTDLNAIAEIRRHRGGKVRIVLMGPGAMHFRDRYLTDRNIVVVRGEPERATGELADAFRNGSPIEKIHGISYLDAGGQIVNTPPRLPEKDVDSLPFPARHLLGDAVYHNPKLKLTPYTTVVTSRSCPFKCIYCVPSSLTFAKEIEFRSHSGRKPPVGFRSPENVEKEIAMLASQGYKAIGFMDDNFIWNEERTAAMCDIMKRYGMVWGCQARVDAITEPIARMLKEGNCMYVDLGVESFNDDILEYIHKGIKSADIYRAIGLLKKHGVPVKLNVLIGSSPLETRQTVLHTLREAKKLKVDQVMFNIVSPFPGTEFYTLCKENGWLSTPDYVPTDVQREAIVNLPHLSAREMEKLLFRNNLNYFLSWDFIRRQLRRFKSVSEFMYALKALKLKLFG